MEGCYLYAFIFIHEKFNLSCFTHKVTAPAHFKSAPEHECEYLANVRLQSLVTWNAVNDFQKQLSELLNVGFGDKLRLSLLKTNGFVYNVMLTIAVVTSANIIANVNNIAIADVSDIIIDYIKEIITYIIDIIIVKVITTVP